MSNKAIRKEVHKELKKHSGFVRQPFVCNNVYKTMKAKHGKDKTPKVNEIHCEIMRMILDDEVDESPWQMIKFKEPGERGINPTPAFY